MLDAYPHEACGVVRDGEYISCHNAAADSAEMFRIALRRPALHHLAVNKPADDTRLPTECAMARYANFIDFRFHHDRWRTTLPG